MPLKNLPTNLLNPICLSGIILIFYFYSFLFLFSYILNYNFVSTSFFFISSISSLSSAPLFFISQFCSIFHSISSVHLFFYSFFFSFILFIFQSRFSCLLSPLFYPFPPVRSSFIRLSFPFFFLKDILLHYRSHLSSYFSDFPHCKFFCIFLRNFF